jgi:hypothetical protein
MEKESDKKEHIDKTESEKTPKTESEKTPKMEKTPKTEIDPFHGLMYNSVNYII